MNTEINQFDIEIDRTNTDSLKWEKYAGSDILPLWVADMDFKASDAIIKALHEKVEFGIFGYTNVPEELKSTLQQRLLHFYNWETKKDWQVWMPGMVPGLNIACRAYAEEGDDVITGIPVYPPFLLAPGNFNQNILKVPLIEKNNVWKYDLEAMRSMVTPRTKIFELCNPHNPVGRVFSKQELQDLADFCMEEDLVICSDEIHCELVLDKNKKHIPTATLSPEIESRTVTMMAPSKTFNIPGFGCSLAIISNPKLRNQFKKALTGIVPDAAALGYYAALAAYKDSEVWRQELLEYLRNNRDYLLREFENIPGIKMFPVESTYLGWLDVSELNLENPDKFFEDAGVGLSDGRPFGMTGYMRINFGCPKSTLVEAVRRIRKALVV
jgi:cystathionine beta-lyase